MCELIFAAIFFSIAFHSRRMTSWVLLLLQLLFILNGVIYIICAGDWLRYWTNNNINITTFHNKSLRRSLIIQLWFMTYSLTNCVCFPFLCVFRPIWRLIASREVSPLKVNRITMWHVCVKRTLRDWLFILYPMFHANGEQPDERKKHYPEV